MSQPTRIIAHGQRADSREFRDAVEAARSRGRPIDVRVTWEQGDTARLTQEAMQIGARDLVVAGGDGSVNEAVNAILGFEDGRVVDQVALGIVPVGTANDLGESLGLTTGSLDEQLRFAVYGSPVPVDVVESDARRFINVATGGFGAEVTSDTPELLKRALGTSAYYLTGLTKLPEFVGEEATVRAERFEWTGRFLAMAVCNGRQAGGGRQLCPDALLDDGQMHVSILPDGEGSKLLKGIRSETGAESSVLLTRSSWLEVRSNHAMTFNFDGEPVESSEFRFRVLSRVLRLRAPADSSLLTSSSDRG